MHREDNSNFLLYIEPDSSEKSKEPINDAITELMQIALNEAEKGSANYSDINANEANFSLGGWRGWHTTDCGVSSDNHDYLLKNGMVTNSLAVFYLQYYRNSISDSEFDKIKKLVKFYSQQL